MHLHSSTFPTGGHCDLSLEQPAGWLRATWSGYIGPAEALRGGQSYLQQTGPLHCLYLLNDNGALRGPWFDSFDWLRTVWLPQAQLLGLRYVAHVAQADTQADILTLHLPTSLIGELEIQLFEEVESAEDWLRRCQQPLQTSTINQAPFTRKMSSR